LIVVESVNYVNIPFLVAITMHFYTWIVDGA